MTDWAHFTPWASLAGGILIGADTAMVLLLNGMIAGTSGILGGLLRPNVGDIGCRVAFIAGLLVELGTRYGSGCTSGHDVSGLSQLSPRFMVATAVFMAAGFRSCSSFAI